MFSTKWIIGGIAVILLAVVILLTTNNRVFNFSHNKEPETDTLEMMQKLTPQIANLSNELKKSPENADLFYLRANEYLDFGNIKYALIDYKKAYQIDTSNVTYAMGLSDCLFEANNADGAIAVLLDYLQHDPNNIDVLLTLGMDYLFLPKPAYKKSLEAFNAVLKIDVQDADAYFYKGIIFKETGDTASALSSFQTTIEVDPDYYSAYMQLGTAYADKGNPIAIKYLNSAIAINDTSSEARYAIAKFYQDNGQLTSAIKYYKQMITYAPQNADAIYNLATIYYGIDSIETAYRMYELSIRQAPAKAMGYYGKGLCAEELKKTNEAISLYNQALNLDPDLKVAEERLQKLTEN